jgi:hypothetical protein
MQKREVEQSTLFFGIALPIGGWIAAAHLAGIALAPFPQATTAALHATRSNSTLLAGLMLGAAVAVVLGYLLKRYGDDGYRGAPYRRVLRGTRMANPYALKRLVKAANRRTNARQGTSIAPVTIGDLPMPIHLENRGLLICGSIGTGKSVAIESLIASAIRRRDKLVITDPDGTLLSKFYFPGDIVLNPFDQRSVGWTIFNEIRSLHDFDRIAKSVIPPALAAEDEQWCEFARNILADTMRKLVEQDNPSVDTLVDMLIRDDGDVIRTFLAHTDSTGYFRDNAERATASVQFLMTKYVRPLRYMSQGEFSLYQWVHDPNAGNLFMPWREDMRTALKPLVATWVDMICSTILSFEPHTGKRLWMFLDELQSLGKLESFVPAATKGRRYGLRIVAGLQDWAQLDHDYGRDSAKILLGCFRNYLLLGASSALNADKASEIIGDHEVERLRLTTNANMRGGGRSRNVSHEKERVVLDSEISNLPDLSAYVLFAEEFPLAKITLGVNHYPVRAPAFQIA